MECHHVTTVNAYSPLQLSSIIKTTQEITQSEVRKDRKQPAEVMITIFSMGTAFWLLMVLHSCCHTKASNTFTLQGKCLEGACGWKGFGHQVIRRDTSFVLLKGCWLLFSVGKAVSSSPPSPVHHFTVKVNFVPTL